MCPVIVPRVDTRIPWRHRSVMVLLAITNRLVVLAVVGSGAMEMPMYPRSVAAELMPLLVMVLPTIESIAVVVPSTDESNDWSRMMPVIALALATAEKVLFLI